MKNSFFIYLFNFSKMSYKKPLLQKNCSLSKKNANKRRRTDSCFSYWNHVVEMTKTTQIEQNQKRCRNEDSRKEIENKDRKKRMLLHNVNGCGTFSRMPLFLRRHSFPCSNRDVTTNRVERPKQNNFPLKYETIFSRHLPTHDGMMIIFWG